MPSKSFEMPPNGAGPATAAGFFKSQLLAKPPKIPLGATLSGKSAIVTGGNVGLGFVTCRQLLSLGLSHLVIAVRTAGRGEDAAATLRSQYPSATIEVWLLDMTSYESVQAFARRASSDLPKLDIAILNAGVIKPDFALVKGTGHEETIQTNYLSTVLLAILLLPVLKAKSASSGPGRLTIVGSGVAHAAKFPNRNEDQILASYDDPSKWDPNERYWVSKLLGHYFLVKLVDYVDPKDVIVNIVDPGLTKGTGLNRHQNGVVGFIMYLLKMAFGRSLEVGASTYIDAAVLKGEESHGCFVLDWEISPFATLIHAPDAESVTERLWNETIKELEFAGPLRILESLRQ